MVKRYLSIIDQTGKIPKYAMLALAGALDMQAKRDFADVWNINADVSVGTEYEENKWPVYIVDKLDTEGQLGYHYIDENDVPFAKIELRDDFSVTVSHEMLEMLVNPFLDNYKVYDITPNLAGDERFLLEIAGPVQTHNLAYEINDVRVSNFLTPAYFDLLVTEGKKYDFLGKLTKPRSLFAGGYISFLDKFGQWWQAFATQNSIDFRRLSDGKILGTPTADRLLRGAVLLAGAITLFYLCLNIFKKLYDGTTNKR